MWRRCSCTGPPIVKGPDSGANLRWTSEFPRSYRAFKKLIKKVKRWKRHGRWKWNIIASTSRRQWQEHIVWRKRMRRILC
ncbi:hypothetical protein ZWY2020_025068 [Hordeum vulgare]|nr:hypothetical protein ZWY2020_025068 [Hordeum vulgare]